MQEAALYNTVEKYGIALPMHSSHSTCSGAYYLEQCTRTKGTHRICSEGSSSNRWAGTAVRELDERSLDITKAWNNWRDNAVSLQQRYKDHVPGLMNAKLPWPPLGSSIAIPRENIKIKVTAHKGGVGLTSVVLRWWVVIKYFFATGRVLQ